MALRPLGAGTAGIETVFFILVLAGRVFGPASGSRVRRPAAQAPESTTRGRRRPVTWLDLQVGGHPGLGTDSKVG
jgi:hypothetical protein